MNMTPRLRRLLLVVPPVALAALTAGITFAPIASGLGTSDQALRCGGANNRVQAEFDIAHASDYRTIFPRMGQSPELDGDNGPAHVVVFEGAFDATDITAGQPAAESVPPLMNVVCVITADGNRNVYANVDMTDARIP